MLALRQATAAAGNPHRDPNESAGEHQVASLRFFAGCTKEQTAAAMDVSPATVAREWRFARAWLHERLMNDPASS